MNEEQGDKIISLFEDFLCLIKQPTEEKRLIEKLENDKIRIKNKIQNFLDYNKTISLKERQYLNDTKNERTTIKLIKKQV